MVAGQDVGYPVAEAARRLGLSPGALRKRIKRGTVPAYKGLDGQWYVPVPRDSPQDSLDLPHGDPGLHDESPPAYDAAQDAGQPGQCYDRNAETAHLYERLIQQQADEIAHLRAELERERDRATRERERADTIIMHLSQRMAELQAPRSTMVEDTSSSVSQDTNDTQPQPVQASTPAPAEHPRWRWRWRWWPFHRSEPAHD